MRVVVDPDDPEDEQRLRRDRPIIEALARHIISAELGVPTRTEVWRSAVRRIAGARWMIGQSTVDQLQAGATIPRRSIALPSNVNLRTRGKPQHPHLAGLSLRVIQATEGCVSFEIKSSDGLLTIEAAIDFVSGEVEADLLNGVLQRDDGSPLAIERAMQVAEWLFELMCNGRLQILESETEYLIAESKPVMPQNLMVSFDGHKASRGQFALELERRRAANQ